MRAGTAGYAYDVFESLSWKTHAYSNVVCVQFSQDLKHRVQ